MRTEPTHTEIATGLRQLADLIEATPDIRVSYKTFSLWCVSDRETLAALARAALRHGAKVEKDIDDQWHNLVVKFGPIEAKALAFRSEVCERVLVGTREVTEMVPDPTVAVPDVPLVEQTRTEEIYEWECVPLLAADAEVSA
jgi:hypothetical protein